MIGRSSSFVGWPDSWRTIALVAFLLGYIAWSPASLAQLSSEQTAIVSVLKSTFERADAPLVIEPVVVVGEHAVAGWVQDKRGGRALMRKSNGKWSVFLCSGDPLKHADMLASTGIPVEIAGVLARQLDEAERQLPADRVALFSTFEGVVHIGSDGQHPPVGHRRHH